VIRLKTNRLFYFLSRFNHNHNHKGWDNYANSFEIMGEHDEPLAGRILYISPWMNNSLPVLEGCTVA
jgi:hypothetical protein